MLQDPLGAHHLSARGKLSNLPSPISGVSLKFLQTSLPLASLRTLLGFSEGPGFSNGSEVGRGSGVEGVISSRVIEPSLRSEEPSSSSSSGEVT